MGNDENTRSDQTLCDPGYYCNGDGLRRPCSAMGFFGKVSGLSNSTCTARCPKGHYCTPDTLSPVKCPAGRYGASTGLQNAECTGECSPGYYCPESSVSATQVSCPAGRYGAVKGLKTDECSADCDGGEGFCEPTVCEEGFYCPLNSIAPTQLECGGEGVYCPEGSGATTAVSSGYYTIGNVSKMGHYSSIYDENRRFDQIECEAGTYCDGGKRLPCAPGRYASVTGSTSDQCEGACDPGYVCPTESTSSRQIRCGGPGVFCPGGTHEPTPVAAGYYSHSGGVDTRSLEAICPTGSYCVGGVARLCPAGRFGSVTGLADDGCEGLCKKGFYCPEGSTSETQVACPVGRYSGAGAKNEKCDGICAKGYYCPLASFVATQFQCGGEMNYCPEGSAIPHNVTIGYYSVGGNSTTRSWQVQCNVVDTIMPGKEFVMKNDGAELNGCPSTTRVTGDDVQSYPQHINVDYHIDPENEYKYDHEWSADINNDVGLEGAAGLDGVKADAETVDQSFPTGEGTHGHVGSHGW